MARLSREESQAQTRERIMGAARALIARSGYGAASIRDIAETAGYSQGAFYSNFASKEHMMLALMRAHMEEEARTLESFFSGGSDAPDPLGALEQWAASMNADADWAMIAIELQLNANRNPEFAAEFEAMNTAHAHKLGALVARLFVSLGKVPPADPVAIARGLMALVHGLALQRAPIQPDPGGAMLVLFLKALIGQADPA